MKNKTHSKHNLIPIISLDNLTNSTKSSESWRKLWLRPTGSVAGGIMWKT